MRKRRSNIVKGVSAVAFFSFCSASTLYADDSANTKNNNLRKTKGRSKDSTISKPKREPEKKSTTNNEGFGLEYIFALMVFANLFLNVSNIFVSLLNKVPKEKIEKKLNTNDTIKFDDQNNQYAEYLTLLCVLLLICFGGYKFFFGGVLQREDIFVLINTDDDKSVDIKKNLTDAKKMDMLYSKKMDETDENGKKVFELTTETFYPVHRWYCNACFMISAVATAYAPENKTIYHWLCLIAKTEPELFFSIIDKKFEDIKEKKPILYTNPTSYDFINHSLKPIEEISDGDKWRKLRSDAKINNDEGKMAQEALNDCKKKLISKLSLFLDVGKKFPKNLEMEDELLGKITDENKRTGPFGQIRNGNQANPGDVFSALGYEGHSGGEFSNHEGINKINLMNVIDDDSKLVQLSYRDKIESLDYYGEEDKPAFTFRDMTVNDGIGGDNYYNLEAKKDTKEKFFFDGPLFDDGFIVEKKRNDEFYMDVLNYSDDAVNELYVKYKDNLPVNSNNEETIKENLKRGLFPKKFLTERLRKFLKNKIEEARFNDICKRMKKAKERENNKNKDEDEIFLDELGSESIFCVQAKDSNGNKIDRLYEIKSDIKAKRTFFKGFDKKNMYIGSISYQRGNADGGGYYCLQPKYYWDSNKGCYRIAFWVRISCHGGAHEVLTKEKAEEELRNNISKKRGAAKGNDSGDATARLISEDAIDLCPEYYCGDPKPLPRSSFFKSTVVHKMGVDFASNKAKEYKRLEDDVRLKMWLGDDLIKKIKSSIQEGETKKC